MGTATSRTLAPALCLAAVLAGCGGSGTASRSAATPAGTLAAIGSTRAPAGWRSVRIATGATLFYPPGWRLTRGDGGSATAVLLGSGGRTEGYLNLTPRQSNESLRDWTSFRVRHNIEEGERDVRSEAAAPHVAVAGGRGACVRDSYTTVTNARYVEIACLVQGRRADSVIVAAAPPGDWSTASRSLTRAVSSVST